MITFTRGNDSGFVLLKSVILIFFIFLLMLSVLEVEYRKYVLARSEYEQAVVEYESEKEKYK